MPWSDILIEEQFSFSGSFEHFSDWFPTIGIKMLALSSDAFQNLNIQFYIDESPDASTVRATFGPFNDPWTDVDENQRPYGDGFKRTFIPAMRYARVHISSGTGSGGVFYSLRGIPY